MNDDQITFEVDGITLQGRKGDMLIEVTDKAGINIPRFCYHRKLSIAANCRMCLVEVARAPKPLPACSTPISEGMKVSTRSPKALSAQRATMEFLLINHPLDCPICDQGGECELQDVAMGYGEGVGQYSEFKRVVKDKDIGPLIATDMTRCIHCTRCVRFGEEIAGLKELGATGRSDKMEIGTYVAKSVTSELSGNVIDLCPVGALTAKPSRYTHRPWELMQHPHVSIHDAFGSNMYLHTRDGQVMRTVPRENEAVNETWIADRDRYAYTALSSEERLTVPMIRRDGEWIESDWDEALAHAAEAIGNIVRDQGGAAVGALGSATASLEELYLLQKLVRGLGSNHVDHRLRQVDFSADAADPVMPWLGMDIAEIASLDAALVIGSNVREEIPLFGHRLRQAALVNHAEISFLHPFEQSLTFPAKQHVAAGSSAMVASLAQLLEIAGGNLPSGVRAGEAIAKDQAEALVAKLRDAGSKAVFLGHVAQNDPHAGTLRQLASLLSEATGARFGVLAQGGNQAGAWLAGAVPHRVAGGGAAVNPGMNAAQLLSDPRPAMILMGIEPEYDSTVGSAALDGLARAEVVVGIGSYVTDSMRRYANVLLPAGSAVETAGTWVNGEGRWQSVRGCARPQGQARPAWKILRVLGNLLDLTGFEYTAADEIRHEVQQACANVELDNRVKSGGDLPSAEGDAAGQWTRIAPIGMYALDAVVRRAQPLQETEAADRQRCCLMHPADAEGQGWNEGDILLVGQDGASANLPLRTDERIARGSVVIYVGPHSAALPGRGGSVSLDREVAA